MLPRPTACSLRSECLLGGMSAVHAPDTALSKPSRPSCCTKYQKSRVVLRLDRPTQRTFKFKSTSATARGPAVAPKVTRAAAFGSVEHTVRVVFGSAA